MLERRTLLFSAVGVALSGCSVLGSGPTKSNPTAAPSAAAADAKLLSRVHEQITQLHELWQARPQQANAADWIALHAAHLTALDEIGQVTASKSSPEVPKPLLAGERQLHLGLRQAAIDATQPGFCQLLASMAAAQAQRTGINPAPDSPSAADDLARGFDQGVLSALVVTEQQTVFDLGWLLARSTRWPDLQRELTRNLFLHRTRRSTWEAALAESVPPTPPSAREVPATRRVAAQLASDVLARSVRGYLAALPVASGSTREFLVNCVEITAVRGLAFRGGPEILPGLR